jgi:hypothetical protein
MSKKDKIAGYILVFGMLILSLFTAIYLPFQLRPTQPFFPLAIGLTLALIIEFGAISLFSYREVTR